VQLAAGIGEHGEAVEFGFATVFFNVENAVCRPFFAGGGLGEGGLVVFLHDEVLPMIFG
jgi:hypothetical protein